jgi:hypothetical protein
VLSTALKDYHFYHPKVSVIPLGFIIDNPPNHQLRIHLSQGQVELFRVGNRPASSTTLIRKWTSNSSRPNKVVPPSHFFKWGAQLQPLHRLMHIAVPFIFLIK